METDGGGWTLVWSYHFSKYYNFQDGRNAITPRPNWPANANRDFTQWRREALTTAFPSKLRHVHAQSWRHSSVDAVVLPATTSFGLFSRGLVDVSLKRWVYRLKYVFSLQLPLYEHLTANLFIADEFEADFHLIDRFLVLILITALRHTRIDCASKFLLKSFKTLPFKNGKLKLNDFTFIKRSIHKLN